MLDLAPGVHDFSDVEQPVLIGLLGSFRLTLRGQLASIKSEGNAERLLIELALHRDRRLPSARLLAAIWPDSEMDQARKSLHSLTYKLNQMAELSPAGQSLIRQQSGFYRLDDDAVAVDIDLFDTRADASKRQWRRGDHDDSVAEGRRALALYRGDLCDCGQLRATIERERLRVRCLEILARQAEHHIAQERLGEALRAIEYMLKIDPYREDAHRQAMRCYVQMGRRAQALRQYQLCRRVLAAEFEAAPEPATELLYDRIREGRSLARC